jgi:hypothetical protein
MTATAHAKHIARVLEHSAAIESGYQHSSKHVTPGDPVELDGALLKWYEVHSAAKPVSDDVRRLARAHLMETRLDANTAGLGFAILHRCGEDFYFLIVGTWRNSNELWQTVFYKDGAGMKSFEPFRREGAHIPTLCVWELVPVWHEQQAWVRFLKSPRDAAAAEAWASDRYAGEA